MKKTVLVTGGTRGLGKAICYLFAQNDYNIIINYYKSESLAENIKLDLEREFNINVFLIKADISNEEEVRKMFETIKREVGSIDVLVNNVGISCDSDLNAKDGSEFKKVVNVNLIGTYLVTKYSLLVLKKGAIINISSTNGIDTGYIESVDYDASKAGVIALTYDFSKYLAPDIRVNCIAPGWINTDAIKDMNPDFKKKEIAKIALKRFADPKEIAEIVVFLASDKASYINGSVIRVDGGQSE